MTAAPQRPPIASAGEAAKAIDDLSALIDRLIATLQEETAHMRAGRLRDALALEAIKSELARRYAVDSSRLKAARSLAAGAAMDALKALRRKHEHFQKLLQTNLTVLATAHAVSEGIIRGVSGEMAKKRTPSTYGATGRANAPSLRAAQPLAVSRSL